jgi:hypothetical protein
LFETRTAYSSNEFEFFASISAKHEKKYGKKDTGLNAEGIQLHKTLAT